MKQFFKNISPFNNRTDMSIPLFSIKKVLAFWVCYFAGLGVSEAVILLLHFPLGKNFLVGELLDPKTVAILFNYGFIMLCVSSMLYWKFIEKKPLAEMGLSGSFSSYALGALLAVVLLFLCVAGTMLTGSITFNGIFSSIDFLAIVLLALGFVIQGAAEEFLCRGLVFHAMKAKTSIPIAMAVSTLVFIWPHWGSLSEAEPVFIVLGLLNLTLISVIFCLLTLRFNSIWAACGLHSFWNAILSCVLGLNLSGNEENVAAVFSLQTVGETVWNGGAYGIEASLITALVFGVAALLLLPKKN